MIVVIILLLLAGGWYFMSSKKTDSEEQQSAATNLKDLIDKGIAQTCTFTVDKSKGVVYVNGGKVREDFEITLDKEVIKSHIIITDNTMYNWSDGQKMGIKMAFDPKATPVAVESPNPGSGGEFNANTNMDYQCSVWLPDSGKFTPPSDIIFTSSNIPTLAAPANETSEDSSSQCAYCNVLTGDDKTQCLTALKCN